MTRHDFILRGILAATTSGQTTGLFFSRGLNIISGASNTGKSYAVRCIDYMLGGEAPPRPISQLVPYEELLLGVDTSSHVRQTLRRSTGGGHVRIVDADVAAAASKPSRTQLTQKHHATRKGNISAYLLELCDLWGRKVRKNAAGETQSVSFRNLSKFTIIQESSIFKDGPLFLTGQYTTAVFETGLFQMLLTGQDDSPKSKRPGNKTEQIRLTAQSQLLDGLIDDNRREQARLDLPADPVAEITKIDATITQHARVVAATRRQIAAIEQARQDRWREREVDRIRLDTTTGLAARFELLREQYRSDLQRLDALIELNTIVDHFPPQTCPYCGAEPSAVKTSKHEISAEFLKAANREKEKVALRAQELGDTICHLNGEIVRLRERIEVLRREIGRHDSQLENSLRPQLAAGSEELDRLLTRRTVLARGVLLEEQIANFQRIRQEHTIEVDSPVPSTGGKLLLLSEMRALCEIMSELLVAWRVPGDGSVSFDYDTQDFVISGQHRADHGKGLKAVIYAAFAVGLMLYCRRFGLPHPGFVVLDSPLVTFQEKDVPADEVIELTLKDAFFMDLADRIKDYQVIVFDNEDIPPAVAQKVTYVRFTGNLELARAGFLEPLVAASV